MGTELNCECDIDFSCDNHGDDATYWAKEMGVKPYPYMPSDAYDADDYKGRFWESWEQSGA